MNGIISDGKGTPMSVDQTTDYYHLTPNGWVKGTSKIYRNVHSEVEPPEDRIETLERYMTQSHAFASEQVTWSRVWKDESYTEDQLLEIRNKFPYPWDFKGKLDR